MIATGGTGRTTVVLTALPLSLVACAEEEPAVGVEEEAGVGEEEAGGEDDTE